MGRHEFGNVGPASKPSGTAEAARFVEDTYVPDFSTIAERTGLAADALSKESIAIPTKLFQFLLMSLLRNLPFDESAYARANPDVARAFDNGELASLFEHYVGTGWFENRSPGWYFVDEQWYARKYRDLDVAYKTGKIRNLSDHFQRTGLKEGRVASAKQLAAKDEWDRALQSDG